MMEPEKKAIPGRMVVFMIGRTGINLEAREVVEVKALKSAPAYLDVIPKQKIIRLEKKGIEGAEVGFLERYRVTSSYTN